jgi:hypothetical protein
MVFRRERGVQEEEEEEEGKEGKTKKENSKIENQ